MVNELKTKLEALGMDAEMAEKAIHTVAEFSKAKLPSMLHPAIDSVMAGNEPDMSKVKGLFSSLKGFINSK
ncbi:MAG: hypothetical protein AB8D78_10150 [Akkermansiaceae bacterium]